MVVDRKRIESQLASLEKQESLTAQQVEDAKTVLAEIRGAQRQCRHWLDLLVKAESEATSPNAGANGVLAE